VLSPMAGQWLGEGLSYLGTVYCKHPHPHTYQKSRSQNFTVLMRPLTTPQRGWSLPCCVRLESRHSMPNGLGKEVIECRSKDFLYRSLGPVDAAGVRYSLYIVCSYV
jgi:hypothetical protein